MLKNLAIVVGLVAGLSACMPYGYNGYDSTGYGYNQPAYNGYSYDTSVYAPYSPLFTGPATMDTATDVMRIRQSSRIERRGPAGRRGAMA